MERTGVGIIGCGTISDIYLSNLTRRFNETVEVLACADIVTEHAREKAMHHGIPKVCSVKELLDDPRIKLVVDLTVPAAHAEVNMAALRAHKNVYCEKPLALTRAEAQEILAVAGRSDLLVGGAPDTFFGGGIQTCIKLIRDGWIGKPVTAQAFMVCHGHEMWHPSPEFYYKRGGGPLFDMGPYYLTALVNLLGPVKTVSCLARKTFSQRTITSQPFNGRIVDVEVPTHYMGLLEFAEGAIATLTTSFDMWESTVPFIEVHGTDGSISVPDPNRYCGPVRVSRGAEIVQMFHDLGVEKTMEARATSPLLHEIPLSHGYVENSRGVGVADMARALQTGRPHRANGELTAHVVDIMCSLDESGANGRPVTLKSTCRKPEPLPLGLADGSLD